MKFLVKSWGACLCFLTATACTPVGGYVDNYFLGKDNTPEPQLLKPIASPVTTLSFAPQWSVPLKKEAQSRTRYLKIKPVVSDKTLYTASSQGLIYAIDNASGKIKWSKQLEDGIVSGPLVLRDRLVVVTDASRLVILDTKAGAVVWQVAVSGEVLSTPLLAGGKLIVKTMDGHLVAYDFATGKSLWTIEHGTPSLVLKASSSPVMQNEHVALVGYADGKIDAVDIDTGRTLWQRSIAYAQGASDVERLVDIDADPIIEGSTVFLASFQGYVGALSLENGQFIWRKPASIYKNMLVRGKTLYAVDGDDLVWSIDKTSGRVNWKQVGLKSRGLTEPRIVGDKLIFGDKTGLVHLLSTKTGAFLTRFDVGSAINTAPTVVGNTLYLATTDGKITRYALNQVG